MEQNQLLSQLKEQEKQFLDIKTAPFIFLAKELPLYFDISYVGALKLAQNENFGFRCGTKKLYIHRDKFIEWLNQTSEIKCELTNQKYWETETPITSATDRNLIRYFKKARRLQVAAVYKNKKTGELKQGKTATLDVEDMAANPEALDLLQQIIADCRELGGKTG